MDNANSPVFTKTIRFFYYLTYNTCMKAQKGACGVV
jgi:hypothetical protein